MIIFLFSSLPIVYISLLHYSKYMYPFPYTFLLSQWLWSHSALWHVMCSLFKLRSDKSIITWVFQDFTVFKHFLGGRINIKQPFLIKSIFCQLLAIFKFQAFFGPRSLFTFLWNQILTPLTILAAMVKKIFKSTRSNYWVELEASGANMIELSPFFCKLNLLQHVTSGFVLRKNEGN